MTQAPTREDVVEDSETAALLDEAENETRSLLANHEGATWSLNWQIGDAARLFETRGQLKQYAERLDDVLSYGTIRQCKSVADAFPEKRRRNSNLTWTHHRVVSTSPDRYDWLKKAASKKWSVAQLVAEFNIAEASARNVTQVTNPSTPEPVAPEPQTFDPADGGPLPEVDPASYPAGSVPLSSGDDVFPFIEPAVLTGIASHKLSAEFIVPRLRELPKSQLETLRDIVVSLSTALDLLDQNWEPGSD